MNVPFALTNLARYAKTPENLDGIKEARPKQYEAIRKQLQNIADKYQDHKPENSGSAAESKASKDDIALFIELYRSGGAQNPIENKGESVKAENKKVNTEAKKTGEGDQKKLENCNNILDVMLESPEGLKNPSFNPLRQINALCDTFNKLSEEAKGSPEFQNLKTIVEELNKYKDKQMLNPDELRALKDFLENHKRAFTSFR